MMAEHSGPNGILIVDKPKGITSHDVVNIARRLFKTRRIGHAGALDPIATGILILLIGKATKMSNVLMGEDKEYKVTLKLGIMTDTGDALGKVTMTSDISGITDDMIQRAIRDFTGEIEQVPPMFSAVKFKGKPLYKWARKGVTVHRKPRRVFIRDIRIKGISLPYVIFEVSCTKGTYIRQLCADIGNKLESGAHMTELRRIKSGRFHISQARRIDTLESLTAGELQKAMIT